jgi:hypothetical protein
MPGGETSLQEGQEMNAREQAIGPLAYNRLTLVFLAATVVLIIAALLVGISDNPPGILLLYGAGLALVLAVTHRWRSPRKFGFLFLGAAVGFFITVAIHNFAEVGAERISNLPLLAYPLSAVSVAGFILAVIVCPAAAAVGALGWITTVVRGGREAR